MNISAHGKYPVRHKNMWHGGGMITVKGVRATNPPLQTTFRGGDNSPQFSVKGDNVGAGFIPALTPQKIYKQMARGENDYRQGGEGGDKPRPYHHHFKQRLGSETIPRNSVSRVTM